MPFAFRPTRAIAGAIALGCFGAGLVGAYSAHDVDTRLAVDDARDAAQALEVKREALESSLTEAHSALHEADAVADEERVAAAARALSDATQAATEKAALSGVHVTVAPVDPEEIAAVTPDDFSPAPADDDGAEAVTKDVAPESTETEDEGAPAPIDPSGTPSPSPSASPADDSPHPLAPAGDLVELVEDAEVARVLAGQTESADEAREAADRLERATETLDDALESVTGGATALTEAAIEAGHADTLVLLDSSVENADAVTASALDTLASVEDRVDDDSRLTQAEDAITELTSTSARAALVDRDRPLRVIQALDRVVAARAAFDEAMEALQATHEAWVDTENTAIDARNDQLKGDHKAEVADAKKAHVQANRDAAAARSKGWTGSPVGVMGSNGVLALDSLCDIGFLPGHRLQCDAARSLEEADAAYFAQHGRHLNVTDSYRSYGVQVRTRAIKPATAARPGTSNHGWGMAVDLDVPSAAWLRAHGEDFGWVHPEWARPGGSKPESWHLEYVATDVGAFEAPPAPELEKRIMSVFEEDKTPRE
ncbi:hypothetical protein ACNI3K_10740 [Demequina sp. SO4-13]|uniref:hypothetical protein n=1 Tax=Demequina sp. SO4-13 TaxID=3401027 RepID=UPI003AF88D86